MDFTVRLPWMSKYHDTIWVVVDHLTKATHFLALKVTFIAEQLVDLYIKEMVRLSGIALAIVSDCDTKFAFKFWHDFHTTMGIELYFSTTYHP